MVGPVKIQPQWIQNINTVCIVSAAPCLRRSSPECARMGGESTYRAVRGVAALMALAFLILPLGTNAGRGRRQVRSCGFSRAMLQSIGERSSPIGYAMIGKLAPRQYQGVMGNWSSDGLASPLQATSQE
jgi:POT family proton-dependent oligopeptide transporter